MRKGLIEKNETVGLGLGQNSHHGPTMYFLFFIASQSILLPQVHHQINGRFL